MIHIPSQADPPEVRGSRVVYDHPKEVVQTGAIVDVTDVHARALADGLQPLEDGDALAPVVRGRLALRKVNVGRHVLSVGEDLDLNALFHFEDPRLIREPFARRRTILEGSLSGTPKKPSQRVFAVYFPRVPFSRANLGNSKDFTPS